MSTNKEIIPLDAYIAPQCELSELETSCAILEGSPFGTIDDFNVVPLF